MPLKASIVLCTRNRAAILPSALDSILESSRIEPRIDVEIIVVDNGSTDGTQDVLSEWNKVSGTKAEVLFEPRAGVSRAKNTGISSSSGDVLVFMDDDCHLSANYMRDLLAHYSGNSGLIVRGGRVELGESADLPFTIKVENEVSQLGGELHPGGFVHGCNLTLTRGVIDRIGGFDERFGPGAPFKAAEDTEFVYRAYRAGIPVEYVPDMINYHYHGRRHPEEIKKLKFFYEYGNGALLAKYRMSNKLLNKHFYWNVRNSFLELFGGKKFDQELGLSHMTTVAGNLAGAWRYICHALSNRFGHVAQRGVH